MPHVLVKPLDVAKGLGSILLAKIAMKVNLSLLDVLRVVGDVPLNVSSISTCMMPRLIQ